jgi:hypothetical protein
MAEKYEDMELSEFHMDGISIAERDFNAQFARIRRVPAWFAPFIVLAGISCLESAHAQPAANASAGPLTVTLESIESLRKQAAESTDLSLAELEQEVPTRELVLASLKAAQSKSKVEPSTRANRRREIRALLLSANQRIVDVQKQLDAATTANEPALLTNARRDSLQVRRRIDPLIRTAHPRRRCRDHRRGLGRRIAFRKAGIEIAFPQCDLHLRSADPSVLFALNRKSDK